MTEEVAVLNKEGVARAADSAVTIRHTSGQEIFTSADEIFVLSRHLPVAVMIYGNRQLMGVPFETIIKTYHSEGEIRFGSLEEQA